MIGNGLSKLIRKAKRTRELAWVVAPQGVQKQKHWQKQSSEMVTSSTPWPLKSHLSRMALYSARRSEFGFGSIDSPNATSDLCMHIWSSCLVRKQLLSCRRLIVVVRLLYLKAISLLDAFFSSFVVARRIDS